MGVSYLLDTHVLVWLVSGKPSTATRRMLENLDNDLFVSAVSAFEIATKVRLGKLDAARGLHDRWEAALTGLGALEMPLDRAAARRAGELTWANRDPFDRLLAAQAITEGMTLVTADRSFDDVPGLLLLRW